MTYQDIINDLISGKIYTNLDPTRRSIWPKYCYHFTDLQNALNVFKQGAIYSRKLASGKNLMKNEDANENIINSTHDEVYGYARFYFRPQTPMLYQTEGFRPIRRYKYGNKDKKGRIKSVKCPFPIYFLFDLSEVLNLDSSKFSPISLARHQSLNLKDSPEEFANMPFEAIYSNGKDRSYRNGYDNRYYTSHKQAEVVVKDYLSLKYLKKIEVRSKADAVTLKQELTNLNLNQYIHLIRIDTHNVYFHRQGCYVKDVSFNSNGFKASFNVPSPKAKVSNQYLSSRYYPNIQYTGQNISGNDLNWLIGYKIMIKVRFPNGTQTIVYPSSNGVYCSKGTCNFNLKQFIKGYRNEPYSLKIYLSTTQQEPAYYAKYEPKQSPTPTPGNGINTNFGNNNDTFSDDDLPF